MRTIEVALTEGLIIGETRHTLAQLRELTAGDILDATEESEKLIYTKNGAELIASPTLVGLHVLRRQIVRIGDHEGPLTLSEIKKLSSLDFGKLQDQSQDLESAAMEAANRGRSPEDQGDS